MTEVLKMLPEAAGRGQHFQARGVAVTVVRDRKIRTALRTNQIVGFVTVPSWKKIQYVTFSVFVERDFHCYPPKRSD